MRERLTRERLALAAAVLLVAIPLVLLLRGFTRAVIVSELMRYGWGIRVLFESLPQWGVWIAFLVVALGIVVSSLASRGAPQPPDHEGAAERSGQVRRLAERIQRAPQGVYFRWRLAHYLRAVTLRISAHRQRTTLGQVERDLDAGRLDVPPEVQAYLRLGLSPSFTRSSRLLSALKRLLTSPKPSAPVDPNVERVVQYLESQLQVEPLPELDPQPDSHGPLEVQHDH